MANDPPRRHLTARDTEILLALDRCPLTVRQLLRLSRTFHERCFTSPRSVQDRLQKLRHAGWVRRWTYATASRAGAPDYYKLTLLGYRLLYGVDARPPTKRYFSEVAVAHQHHTHSLAEFVVHAVVAAHTQGIVMKNAFRENSLRLTVGQENLLPDFAFELHTNDGRQFNFLVELDNGTERVRSDKDADSWQRKIRLYEQLQNQNYPHRFRVLVVTTRSRERLDHILALASAHARNSRRSLFYAIHLDDYVAHPDAVRGECFRDHHGRMVALIPRQRELEIDNIVAKPSPTMRVSGNLFPLPMVASPSPREPRTAGLPSPTS